MLKIKNKNTVWYQGIGDCIVKYIVVSLLYYNRLILILSKQMASVNGYAKHEINISIP